jgi:replicative DNA helicase
MDYDYTIDTIEKILLKRILNDKKYMSKIIDIFDIRWFEKNKNSGIIVNLAMKYFKKYSKLPTERIIKELINKYCEKNGSSDINEMNNILLELSSFNLNINDECANKNLEKYITDRAMYYCISDNVQEMMKSGNVDKCLDRFYKVQKISFQDDDLGSMYFSKDEMDKHWTYINNPEAKIKTGWRCLDNATNGGFLKDGRMLALFAGQAGLGKSLFLSNIAVNFLKQNLSVVVISMEMSQDVYSTRFDSVIADTDINGLKYSHKTARQKIEEFYNKHPGANLVIKEFAPKSTRVIDIESYLEKLQENNIKIDVIVVDYLNLVLPNTKIDGMYESIKLVAEQLRGVSYKFNAPVISATQVNRQGMNNENVDLQNISESSGQAATADFIGMIYQTPDDRSNGVLNLRVCKNRFGAPGRSLQFMLNGKTLELKDLEEANEEDIDDLDEASMILDNVQDLSSDINMDL